MLKIFANIIFIVHLGVVFILLFGWAFPSFSIIYLTAIVATLASEVVLGYCVLTKWEFILRKKLEPSLNYNYSFLSYYAYRLIGEKVSEKFIKIPALIFLNGSLIIYVWNHWLTK